MSPRLDIAVVGSGISGLAAAWLLGRRHDVTLYERAERLGGHSNTVLAALDGRHVPVDTGFIVFNRAAYPNLAALFEHLGVPTRASDMSFAASLDGGRLEYAGGGLIGLFGQPGNLLRPRFWSMLADIVRFYRIAAEDAATLPQNVSLGDYLDRRGFGAALRDDHLLPMASAVWSATPSQMLAYPAAAFIRFHDNHGLLRLHGRPAWETVIGGSMTYVRKLAAPLAGRIRLDTGVRAIRRMPGGVLVEDDKGDVRRFDHVVMAGHADQMLEALADPSERERELLGAFRYSRNLAVLHTDASFMPRRRAVWSAWNYAGPRGFGGPESPTVTYWMNRLQNLDTDRPVFVTLNPPHAPRSGSILHTEVYHHPLFDAGALAAQRRLWSLQGVGNTWFCGAYFGAGFHEDGLQAGLAVAEQLGGVRRPWTVANESGRIFLAAAAEAPGGTEVAA